MIALLMWLRNTTPGLICGVHLHRSYMSGNGRAFAVSTMKNQLFLMFIASVDRGRRSCALFKNTRVLQVNGTRLKRMTEL